VRAVLRIFVLIPLAFMAACLAAGLFFVLGVIGLGPQGAYLDTYFAETALLAAGVSATAGALVFFPAAAAILLAEVFRWRSVLFYLLAGLTAGLWSAVTLQATNMVATDVGPALFAAAGSVAGFVYWLLAGRSAGIAEEARKA